jgi:hypothetical protein
MGQKRSSVVQVVDCGVKPAKRPELKGGLRGDVYTTRYDPQPVRDEFRLAVQFI